MSGSHVTHHGEIPTVGVMMLAGSSANCNRMGKLHIMPCDEYAPYERDSEPGQK